MSTDFSHSSPEVVVLRADSDKRPSQSLFQVYYLGSCRVDRRCSSSIMPWIIEEHKLKTQEMKLLWLTPGMCSGLKSLSTPKHKHTVHWCTSFNACINA